MKPRLDQRTSAELRPVSFVRDFQLHPVGSVLACCGQTRVICSVSVVPGVPKWMREQNVPGGWLTCEYRMLPTATHSRNSREGSRGPGGRTQEIQRLIGRSLRAVVDLKKLGARTFYVDCDVLDADGGTRCASITGASVAFELAVKKLMQTGDLEESPLRESVAAISVGIVGGTPMLDLCYEEDSNAEVDMNVVMTASGKLVEVQGTAEGAPFSQEEMNEMLGLARQGLERIFSLQQAALA
jgi:ribonuclease PH